MVVRNAILLASKCNSCRCKIWHTFVASFPVIPITSTLRSSIIRTTFSQLRAFTTSHMQRSDIAQQATYQAFHGEVGEELDLAHNMLEEDSRDAMSTQPWYLQLETPTRAVKSLSERQKLPELPADPPPLLGPILDHISIDLGLDDLSLFDLRKLDPPPTLGANLLMILGTARSEKHLHVSADRFCRWLRSKHKLQPHADGLLGRGELKLKMRRKARRARLLSSVGSADRVNQDDGLSTGWICVNVGMIEDGEGGKRFRSEDDEFVGFGEHWEGARVVIQMLTQEKREELDLEELWGNLLERHKKKAEKRLGSLDETTVGKEVGHTTRHKQMSISDPPPVLPPGYERLLIGSRQQIRGFHHSRPYTKLSFPNQNTPFNPCLDLMRAKINPNPNTFPPIRHFQTQAKSETNNQPHFKKSDHHSSLERVHLNASPCDIVLFPSCKDHVTHLANLPRQEAMWALGEGIKDLGSTRFLASFYRIFYGSPHSRNWTERILMVCYGIQIGHSGYGKRKMMALFNEMRSSTPDVDPILFARVIDTLLLSPFNEGHSREASISSHDIYEAVRLFEEIGSRRQEISYEGIMLNFYAAVAHIKQRNPAPKMKLRPDANARLRLLMDEFGAEPMSHTTHVKLLKAFADSDNWPAFWTHWRGIARRMQPKPMELYDFMFRRVAQRRHQSKCIDALRTWVPEMEQEEPALMLGKPGRLMKGLAQAVMECVRVADPDAESDFIHGRNLETEWVILWRRCQQTLGNTTGDA